MSKRFFILLFMESAAFGQEPTATARPLNKSIVVLKPFIRFENVQNGSEIFRPANEVEAYATRLESRAESAVTELGFFVIDAAMPPSGVSLPQDALELLRSQAGKLARGLVLEEAKANLERVGGTCNECRVLVQYMKAKVGPRGTWNPNTGAITSRMDSLLLQACLLDPSTGQTIWKGETYVRELPGPAQDKLLKTLGTLYANFDIK